MRICERAVNFVQIFDGEGHVRLCPWQRDGGIIGCLTQNTIEEIYHSEAAGKIRERHARADYSNCNINQCPYVACNTVDAHSLDIDEIPKYPSELYLAYENVCNYHCIMCNVPGCLMGIDAKELEKNYDKIDAELRKILPHVKLISANGMGELFTSRHILKLLSEWKPLADPSEIQVLLETNGSLFDEEHWKPISNLGKYYLYVAITVLSFEDETYRELSGTNQPVQKLIDNLHYVKSLREQGIIDHLQIATVYQDKNYRQLPDFVRRCLEEFNADTIRLRPFDPWGEIGMKEWLMDVRNVYHPNHADFLEVMKDPIFSHPKVQEWGGGRESGLGPEPEVYAKPTKLFSNMQSIFCDEKFLEKCREHILNKRIVIYGMGAVGKALVSRLKGEFEVDYCLDRAMDGLSYMGIPIYGTNCLDELNKDVIVIICVYMDGECVKEMLVKAGYQNEIVELSDLV